MNRESINGQTLRNSSGCEYRWSKHHVSSTSHHVASFLLFSKRV